MKMVSPALNLEYRITDKGYTGFFVTPEKTTTFHDLSRKKMIEDALSLIRRLHPKRVSIYVAPYDEPNPYVLNTSTLQKIYMGKLSEADLAIGELETPEMMAEELKYLPGYVPLRQIPGTSTYECLFCGRGADRNRLDLVCLRCGALTPYREYEYNGFYVDLREALDRHPNADKLFINQTWNPHPPWMRREEVEALLGEQN